MSSAGAVAKGGAWTGDYKFLSRILGEWKAQYLVKLSAQSTGFHLTKALRFYYELQAEPNTAFMPRWSDEEIALTVFKKRGPAMGGRLLKLLNAGAVSSNGVVDWQIGGAYRFRWADGVATHIIHCSGPEEYPLPSHIRITPAFVLCDNYNDSLARVELLLAAYFLWTLLPKESAAERGEGQG